MFRYENFNFISHLNFLDLSQKFLIINYYVIPKFNKITLKLFLLGTLTSNFLNLYLKNFLLLYLYCFNPLYTKLNFLNNKVNKKQIKLHKIHLILSYSFMKKKILFSIFNFIFIFKKFARPFFFSKHPFFFSTFSGKLFSFNIKIITFIPSTLLIDYKEQRVFPYLKKSKFFLSLIITIFLSHKFFNFFIKPFETTKNFLKNFLLIWYFI